MSDASTTDDFSLRLKPMTVAIALLALIAVGWTLVVGASVLIPIAVAILLWQLLNAIAKLFTRVRIMGWTPPRSVRLAAAIVLMLVGLFVVATQVSENIAAVRAAAPTYQANLEKLIQEFFHYFGQERPPSVNSLMEKIDIGALITTMTTVLGGLIGDAFLVMLYTMFIFLEETVFDKKVDAVFHKKDQADRARAMLERIENRIEKYIWLKTLVSFLTAGVCYLILIFVCVDYAGFWATSIFLLNYIPTIGSLLAILFPAVLTIVQFGAFGPFFVVLITLSLAQFFVGNVIEPRLMGNSLNLSPMVIMLALSLWGALWGVAGMFLSVPITVIAMIVCAEFEPTRPIAAMLSDQGKID